MPIDGPTAFLEIVIVATAVGVLLVFSGLQNANQRALVWWGAGNLVFALGAALLAGRGKWPDLLTIDAANVALLLGYALFWSGARCFRGGPISLAGMLAGPVIWLIACRIAPFHASILARSFLVSGIFAIYAALAAANIWRVPDLLPSRYPAFVLLGLHAFMFAIRVPLAFFLPPVNEADFTHTPWLGWLLMEAMIFLVVMSFLLISMAKERSELRHRHLASTDALTGLASRRFFIEDAKRRLAGARRGGAALLLIDIDHFKIVNDEHGHAAGDAVLRAVAARVMNNVRPGDLVGRLGGDEFACLLWRASATEAQTVGERLRSAMTHGDDRLPVSISIGATCVQASIEDMMSRADTALYAAKRAGRDRVVLDEAVPGIADDNHSDSRSAA